MVAIAVDAMGGDNAPAIEVAGAIAALRESLSLQVVLVGDQERLRAELEACGEAANKRLSIRHASEVVSMKDNPSKVFRKKPDSSMRIATELAVDEECAGMVSAGNSGAVLGHCLFLMKRIPGVERPGIVQVFPTPTGTVAMCDLGANVEASPIMLAQFGVFGAAYERLLNGTTRPRLGVLSNGTEDSKGTELTRAACDILSRAAASSEAEFEFVGYVEGSGLFDGHVDVVATDGFTGNVVLKTAEGVSEALMRMIKTAMTSSPRAKLGALLAKPALLELKKAIHYSEYGGAMLLGVNGLATICHGRSDSRAICNAILMTEGFAEKRLREQLSQAIDRHQGLWKSTKAEEIA
ncbi:MAG: phosphate acyltransferase PlsX [Myxococcales bacterium]|nr:phosphate acyltransferase PlsX [Myxococcales bacterium]